MNAEIYFDGGCRPNPGVGSYGYVIRIYDNNKEIDIIQSSKKLNITITNNIAEYCGLISALKACLNHNITNAVIYGDSKLVIKQVNGNWKTKNKKLSILKNETIKLLRQFNHWELKWVSRENNVEADRLAYKTRDKP